MQTITVERADDGQITVTVAEGGQPGEPQPVASADEALQLVQAALAEESGEQPAEQGTEPAESYAAAWNQEAAKRPPSGALVG